jgi:hypothetical protein
LVKRPGGANELIETGPPQPAQVRAPGFDVRLGILVALVFVVFALAALNVARKAARRG